MFHKVETEGTWPRSLYGITALLTLCSNLTRGFVFGPVAQNSIKLQSDLINWPIPMDCFQLFFRRRCRFYYLDASSNKWLRSCHNLIQHIHWSELGTNESQRKNREHGATEPVPSSRIVGVNPEYSMIYYCLSLKLVNSEQVEYAVCTHDA